MQIKGKTYIQGCQTYVDSKNIFTRAQAENAGGFGDRIFGEEGWWSMHFQCITHSKFFKTTSVILPAKVKKISNPIFTSDLEIGFLASRDGSSGHLLKLGLKVSRPLLVKLEIEAVIFCRLYKIHHGLKLQKTRSMPFRNSHQKNTLFWMWITSE